MIKTSIFRLLMEYKLSKVSDDTEKEYYCMLDNFGTFINEPKIMYYLVSKYELFDIFINYVSQDKYKFMIDIFINSHNYNNKRQTPLMFSIKKNHIYTASKLIELGSNQNSRDVFGNTALHYAMLLCMYPIVHKLALHGKENYFRMTPQDYICNNMKAVFHHIRNPKIKEYAMISTMNQKQLYYIIGIYNTFVKDHNIERETVTDNDIKSVNNYIMDVLRDLKESKVSEDLKW